MNLSKNQVTLISNIVIFSMLIMLFSLAFSFNTKYAFNEDEPAKPYYQGNSKNKNVSIMFNVYWGTEYIDGILDVLDRYGAKATFFVGGSWVEKNSDMLLKIHKRGHEIANHGYFHKDQDKLSYDANINEIEPNNILIEKYIGSKPTLFAPPSGAFSKNTLKASEYLGMKTIMWSKDTIDWRDKDIKLIYERATKNLSFGDLVLAHPTKCTLEALPNILKYYQDSGYSVVTVSENIS